MISFTLLFTNTEIIFAAFNHDKRNKESDQWKQAMLGSAIGF